jgi:hypothetical protein
MKRILILLILIANVYLTKAQKFFYVETGNVAETTIKKKLLKASQFVAKSPIVSDYIIKTEVGAQAESNIPTIKIQLVDSITFRTIFQAEEKYTTNAMNIQPQSALIMAVNTLIEKNIKEIILCAKQDNFNELIKMMKLKKDKT